MKLAEVRYRLSACARCKSLWGRICVFCEGCWQHVYEIQNALGDFSQEYYPFKTYSLFKWGQEQDHLVRPLIYALKGGHIEEPWVDFATEFLFLRSQTELARDAIIVLAPRKKRRDHGFLWAAALSAQTGFKIFDCLGLDASGSEQKFLNVLERQKRRYVVRGDWPRDRLVIFADDTITSGATAAAVYAALDFPSSFEVWTLVSRPRYAAS